jgi:hypothetical protein
MVRIRDLVPGVKHAGGFKSFHSFPYALRSNCSNERAGQAVEFRTLAALSGAGGDFGEPVHLIQFVGAWAQNEFIDSHVGLTLDRFFHRGIRSRQGI